MSVTASKRVRRAAATLVAAGALGAPLTARACDICAIYTATELHETRTGLRLGVAEQYSSFTTLQDGSEEVDNPNDEYLRSAITQVILGYNLHPRVGVQLNLPIISRTFSRFHDGRVEYDDETGPGDLTLTANVLAFERVSERSVFRLSLLGGLKLPSGNPDRIGEELEEGHTHEEGEAEEGEEHEHEESGIHGHDLALGSGSVDGVAGAQLFWSWRRFFLTAGGQYAMRTEGDFDYRYANDLTWTTGPGAFVLLAHGYSFTAQGVFSGETKGKDSLAGEAVGDTGITALYAGPAFGFTWGTSLSAELAADLPVVQHNTGLQIVTDYRLRGALLWRF
jgi:hypothetical protein